MRDPKGPVKAYKSPEELAKKHKVSLDTIMKQVKVGTKVEGEHTTSKSAARITALQHVDELPDYYTRLKKVEKKTMKREEVSVEQQYEKDTKYCLLCRKNEKRQECGYGPAMWDKYSIARIHPANEAVNPAQQAAIAISMKKAGKKPKDMKENHIAVAMGKELDDEGGMIMSQLDQIEMAISKLRKEVKDPKMQVPAWVQSKITMATDYIDTAADYMSSKSEKVSEGMNMKDFMDARKKRERSAARKELSPTRRAGIHDPEKKPERDSRRDAAHGETGHGGRLRPNKVRKARAVGELTKEDRSFSEFMTEVAAWQRKEGKNQSGGLNEKGRKSYERENPGSDLKAPSKKVGNPRRASFCARMKGMKAKLTSAETARDPDSRINKSLRAWNC